MGIFRRKPSQSSDADEFAGWFSSGSSRVDASEIDPHNRPVHRAAAWGGSITVSSLLRGNEATFPHPVGQPSDSILGDLLERAWLVCDLMLAAMVWEEIDRAHKDALLSEGFAALAASEEQRSRSTALWLNYFEEAEGNFDIRAPAWLCEAVAPGASDNVARLIVVRGAMSIGYSSAVDQLHGRADFLFYE